MALRIRLSFSSSSKPIFCENCTVPVAKGIEVYLALFYTYLGLGPTLRVHFTTTYIFLLRSNSVYAVAVSFIL